MEPARIAEVSFAKWTDDDRIREASFHGLREDKEPRSIVKITKLDLIEYYTEIQDHILPHVVDRPLTLVRCPSGYDTDCFYQKHLTESLPRAVDPRLSLLLVLKMT